MIVIGVEQDLDYLRSLQKRDGKCLVHWWYYPDSYETWIAETDVEVHNDYMVSTVHNMC